VGLAGADEGHDAVVAGVGVLHRAAVAIDGERVGHAPNLRTGCDIEPRRDLRPGWGQPTSRPAAITTPADATTVPTIQIVCWCTVRRTSTRRSAISPRS